MSKEKEQHYTHTLPLKSNNFTEQERIEYEQKISSQLTGCSNAGKVLVVTKEDIEYQQFEQDHFLG